MNTEIITIGDEIINGFTVNSNAAYISRKISELGFKISFHSSVGDKLSEMEEQISHAMVRSSLVIVTGGLGSTDDDITKRAIVKVFKRNLVYHDEIMQELKKRYELRGIPMPAINQNQALLPQGAKFFPNKNGTAVGICIAEEGKIFIALPGVPLEMEQILTDEVIPYLNSLTKSNFSRVISLHTNGISESNLSQMLSGKIDLSSNLKLAYLPGFSGVTLRVMAASDSQTGSDDKAIGLADQIEKVCGDLIYGKDEETLESVIGGLLKDNDKTLSVAESCTAGTLGMIITSHPGSSAYFEGGVISYSDDVKKKQLNVSPKIIKKFGAVSEECAVAMAVGARNLFNTSYALSITGIAGPDGGSEQKPVGTTFIGINSAHASYARKFNFGNLREAVRKRSSYAALEMLRREILGIK